jgi:hypothetical protein
MRLLVHTRRAAGEQHEEECQEESDGAGENGPDAGGEVGMAAASVLVDVVPDNDEEGKIAGHDNQRDDEGYGGNERCKEGAAES